MDEKNNPKTLLSTKRLGEQNRILENDAQKRVLIFSLTYHPFIGGAEIAVQEITKRLPNISFDMITLRIDRKLPKFEKIGNVNVYRIGFSFNRHRDGYFWSNFILSFNKSIFPFIAFLKALRLNFKNKYSAIWAIMANYAGFGAMFFKLFHPRTPYLLTLQEGDPIAYIKKRVKFIHPVFKMIFTQADTIQAISNYLASFAVSMGSKKKVLVVPNGVDIPHFSQKYEKYDLEALKKELGKKEASSGSEDKSISPREADIFLITTSRLVLKNGVIDIIRSLLFLPKNIKLLILGDGPEMVSLRKFTRGNNLDERVIFKNFIPHKDIVKYLQISDIFVRPSLSEGFGNSFVEAMAAGLPVIATEVGGIVDFLYDPEINSQKPPTGLFCKVDDSKDIAEKVSRLLGDKELCQKITDNAKELVARKYDWNIVAEDMGKIFNDLF